MGWKAKTGELVSSGVRVLNELTEVVMERCEVVTKTVASLRHCATLVCAAITFTSWHLSRAETRPPNADDDWVTLMDVNKTYDAFPNMGL